MNKVWKSSGIYIMLVLVAIVFISSLYRPAATTKDVSYTDFLQRVQEDKIASVVIDNMTGTILARGKDEQQVRTIAPDDKDLIPELKQHKVAISGKRPDQANWWISLLSTVLLPVLIIVGLWIFMLKQAQSGSNQAISFGKSRAKLLVDNKPKVTFADVAGIEEAKSELQEIVEFL
ncbi:MAG: ATP-dependent metallopeptidase FtsH/Yme1/Tma family protein, partial [Cyanobacteria bacterium NC_groundwater_1444_Ag_S-0.65um_54_12]|nr:ATP-dependent metallopeptidase FtsH/Yme1/Tma family protein [Cyanobacteria bacterium NC_groundwater_1444_Ag_S-0.65um_54_12]